jgi:hypothetical protein
LTDALIDSGCARGPSCACRWRSIRRTPPALLVGHRLLAAVADARGREIFDVSAVGLELTDFLPNLGWRAAALVELTDRRQDARTRQHATGDGLAQLDVVGLSGL